MSKIEHTRMTREDMLSKMASEELQNVANLAISNWEEYEMQLGPILGRHMHQEYAALNDLELAYVYLALMGEAPVGWGEEVE